MLLASFPIEKPCRASGPVRRRCKARVDDQPHISRENGARSAVHLSQPFAACRAEAHGQRDTILRTFLDTRDHLSTDELYRLVKKQEEGIGFTTVYRTLKLLSECGLASEVAFNDGIARYEHQYNRRSHHHMVCTECGSSVEFFSSDIERIEREVGRKHNTTSPRVTLFRSMASATAARKSARAREFTPPESFRSETNVGWLVTSPRFGRLHRIECSAGGTPSPPCA